MRKNTLICFAIIWFCFLNASLVSGQNFQWAYGIGSGLNAEMGTAIAVDDSGNVYTAARFSQNVAIFKNDAQGNPGWFITLNGQIGEIPKITIDNDGNLYVTGYFQSTMDFDPGPSVYNMTALGGGYTYILKLDSGGNFIWAKMINGISGYVKGTNIQFSDNGFIVVTGFHTGIMDLDPGSSVYSSTNAGNTFNAFLVKLDTACNFMWGLSFGGSSYDLPYGLSIDGLDNIIVSGYFADTVDFDPGPSVYNLVAHFASMFVLKLNSSGNFIWARAIIDTESSIGNAIDTDPNGNIYACGYFRDSCDFDPGPGVFMGITNGNSDCFIMKLDNNGNFGWAATFGGPVHDVAYSLAYSNQGAIIATGLYGMSADFDPGPGVFNITVNGFPNSWAYFMESLDINGNFINAKSIGGQGEEGRAILTDSIGNIYVTGSFLDTVDFNPPFQYNLIAQNWTGDIFTMKYGPLNVGVQEVNGSSSFIMYPNPGNGNFTFEFDDFYSGEYVISNTLGEQIKTASFENSRILQCDIEGSAGIYFVNVNTGNKNYNAKLVINK